MTNQVLSPVIAIRNMKYNKLEVVIEMGGASVNLNLGAVANIETSDVKVDSSDQSNLPLIELQVLKELDGTTLLYFDVQSVTKGIRSWTASSSANDSIHHLNAMLVVENESNCAAAIRVRSMTGTEQAILPSGGALGVLMESIQMSETRWEHLGRDLMFQLSICDEDHATVNVWLDFDSGFV
jgi:hypothetical protein